MKFRLCFLGKPGSGKTTIATYLAESYNIPLYDVGAILRKRASQDAHIATIHKEGGLVDSDRVLSIFEDALKQQNFILCGSPRKPEEASFVLNNKLWKDNPGWLVHLDLDDNVAKERLYSRGRFDDLESTILNKRFSEFGLYTEKAIELFNKERRLITVDANLNPDSICTQIVKFLREYNV